MHPRPYPNLCPQTSRPQFRPHAALLGSAVPAIQHIGRAHRGGWSLPWSRGVSLHFAPGRLPCAPILFWMQHQPTGLTVPAQHWRRSQSTFQPQADSIAGSKWGIYPRPLDVPLICVAHQECHSCVSAPLWSPFMASVQSIWGAV